MISCRNYLGRLVIYKLRQSWDYFSLLFNVFDISQYSQTAKLAPQKIPIFDPRTWFQTRLGRGNDAVTE